VANSDQDLNKEKVRLHPRKKAHSMRPGRNELESVDRPASIGRMRVCPSIVVVADAQGAIVVPGVNSKELAESARETQDKARDARTNLYEKARLPSDRTVNKIKRKKHELLNGYLP
jgi:4-hydroxy-4-methyl-2-oxoglutarate aldolase